ncbi:tRNA uracil 4-sulfurtransferase ThiI [Dethiobacter alkaliphilus]|uniref:tRNA uracil 4-sulfurtransferase ThiI n=1 Tax=Dethiobacter alkaliphilus TaxID=427926 RepID=UPI00222692A0|nr:tRNA uracil 4-sulfurtransferase ThiI [Dethiobacter alkaliphilus]MCW3488911.1 tRNA 4-thiouridine(8) synthase ThiI [Dethiobacter alkaliphilus]
MKALFLVRYGEIGLKGKNRKFFENTLTKNIKRALLDVADCRIHQTYSRNFVEVVDGDAEAVAARLSQVFGIVSISPVAIAPLDLDEIKAVAKAEFEKITRPGVTFKVETKRANKRFPYKSPEVSREVGAHLLINIPDLKVDVRNPEIKLEVEIREHETYIYTRTIAGPGGLPVGVAGKGLLLISGGIDSPVAGWMSMKRGVTLEAIHFHSFPFTSDRAKEKVIDLCRELTRFGGKIRLHVAHFTEIQKELRLKTPERLTVTLMRRMMFRIAERLAEQRGALALITGESLGQVASQTMESINVIEKVTTIPVFRPLIGLDKEEIMNISRRIDTYPISIRPYEDCCTVFLPDFPATRPRLADVEEAEAALDIEALISESLAKTETIDITTNT